LYIVLRKD